MNIIIILSLLLLVSLLPNPTFTSHMGIVNGREAELHSRPYMVSLQQFGIHICGGFLIYDQFVLTAAHCWCQGLTLVVGAHDLTDSNMKRIEVESLIVHPQYNAEHLWNDIMLIKLKTKVIENEKVKWISLPEDGDGEIIDEDCSVAGWGKLSNFDPGSDRLMEANTTILSDAECERKWGWKYKASKMICAYGSGGSCKGDSGGPLVCGNTAVGITSFGDPNVCNRRDQPNVYTNITAYLPWINNKTGKRFHGK